MQFQQLVSWTGIEHYRITLNLKPVNQLSEMNNRKVFFFFFLNLYFMASGIENAAKIQMVTLPNGLMWIDGDSAAQKTILAMLPTMLNT